MLVYALTIFLGAFLLFQIQPLIGKFVLPWFGGAPAVWTTCLLFFQVLLVAGYAYAHWSTRKLKPKAQTWLHLGLLLAAAMTLPIMPAERWKPAGNANPFVSILLLLTATVGLPYFVLSSTGPLIQRWFHREFSDRSPYRLYSLSNLGSLLALVSFPFVFEPRLSRRTQAGLWGAGLVLYGIVCGICAWKQRNARSGILPDAGADSKPVGLQKWLWVLLPATASMLLLATTNKLCQDVAVIPFLWVVPLSIYLVSFILCFESEGWYRRVPYCICLAVALAATCWGLGTGGSWPFWRQLLTYGTALFIACMVLHGELYRLRPAAAHLTQYYLSIAVGGAAGGILVALAAPLLFTNYYELHWALVLCPLLILLVFTTEGTVALPLPAPGPETQAASGSPTGWAWLAIILPLLAFAGLDLGLSRILERVKFPSAAYGLILRVFMWVFIVLLLGWWYWRFRNGKFRYWRLLACSWIGLGTLFLAGALWTQAQSPNPDRIYRARNFYGVLTVYEHRRQEPKARHLLLQHGRITHGLQFVDPAQSTWPTTYYGADSGVGLALDGLSSSNRHIGLVGLGSGTLATYAKLGDRFTIYEINPEVIRLAQTRFTFLQNSAARIEIVTGDARLSMERQPPQNFDLLALDAFSGDAIPVHLLTREALELYARHLKPEGIIAVHISNRFLDLAPVVLNLARELEYESVVIDYDETPEQWWLYASTWILLSRDGLMLQTPEINAASIPTPLPKNAPLWTDDFTSLFQILK